ncbi:DUF3131 domain-containing protein [Serratia marcescens]|jgi:hypothetical protein|uniref:DUF3131 domain-containing protein n=1 Tax=Serratia marcescens TaxID=615 RepID=A0AAP8PJM5_SERMA|nr:DUF3131 domain-containing protein [Serratia marcescens]MBH2877759.1 DUF3131 domain-containing protein [Serratia marcescens]MBN5204671.1 DUF3131 domain-containing protein [Serratia marcescens]PNO70498.1 hypothetical protein MC70_010980 [Serratia marcescens]
MAWKHSLLQARSYIAVIIGFLLAFGVVVYVETHMPPAPAESAELTLSADFPTLPAPRALTFDEAVWARIAWQYFVNNTQSNGLANAIDNQPYTTMWDTGSYLMAAISAQRLGIITRDELNARVNAVLTTLSSLPLADGQLPSLYYHTQRSIRLNSLSQNENQPDWSAVDISRLLMALDIVAWLYPEQTAAIVRLTAPWRFDALFMQQEPQQPLNFRAAKKWQLVTQSNRDSYGYQLYAVNGLRRVSPLAGIVLGSQQPSPRTISIDGLRIPYDSLVKIGKLDHPVVTTMPYLLTGLEAGFDIRSAEISWRVMKVQESRYRSHGDYAYVNADNEEQLPRFIDDAVISRFPALIDKSRAEIKEAALQLSTKSVFGWYALFRTPWSDEMRRRAGVLFEPGRGWYEGIIAANGQQSRVIGANTNALILESLVYIAQGPLFCQNCAPAPPANPADGQRP